MCVCAQDLSVLRACLHRVDAETAACRAMWNSFNRRAEEAEHREGREAQGSTCPGKQAGRESGSRQRRRKQTERQSG